MSDSVREIPLEELHISQHQARTRNIDDGLSDLVESIRVHGQLEPILVVPSNGGGPPFSIIAGQRRFLAHQRLGRPTIQAIVRTSMPDEYLTKAISVSENLIRKDLTDRDLIDACTMLYQRYGSVKEVAQELGLPYHRVRSCVKYERLQQELKDIVQEGRLDIQSALRLQDHLDGCPADAHPDLNQLVSKLATMTRVQRNHYLSTCVTDKGETEAHGTDSRSPMDDRTIRQILVTLNQEDHYRLRAWAKEHRLTQDKAGATIIASFLRSQ